MFSFSFRALLNRIRRRKTVWQDFMERLPAGASVLMSGDGFDVEGQIIAQDDTHIMISDGLGLRLIQRDAIVISNYILPDTPLEVRA